MNRTADVFTQDIPINWGQLILRFFKVAVVAFVVMQIKEYVDAGVLDNPGVMVDSFLIASGVLLLDLISMTLRRNK